MTNDELMSAVHEIKKMCESQIDCSDCIFAQHRVWRDSHEVFHVVTDCMFGEDQIPRWWEPERNGKLNTYERWYGEPNEDLFDEKGKEMLRKYDQLDKGKGDDMSI